MQIKDLNSELQKGDKNVIAEATGLSYSLVLKVLQGRRNPNSPKGKIIVDASNEWLSTKRKFIENFNQKEDRGA